MFEQSDHARPVSSIPLNKQAVYSEIVNKPDTGMIVGEIDKENLNAATTMSGVTGQLRLIPLRC
jgi:hypothetical protein